MARRKNAGPSEHYNQEDLLELEREFEERVEAKRRRSVPRNKLEPSKRKKNKAPFLLRFLAWCGVILLCFVAGYVGTSYMLKWIDTPIFLQDGSGQTPDNLRIFLSVDNTADVKLDMQKTALALFYPKNGALVEEKAEIIVRTSEDNIQEAILKLLASSGLFGDTVYVKHVFRNVDTVYLDFSGPFVPALSTAGERLSTLFITGIVRTMRENFPPITKVRFLVDSNVVSVGSPIDLTATWQLPK
jgi:hypothetical protein